MTEEGGSGDNDSATQSNDQEAETDAAQVSLFLSLSLSLSLSLAGIYLSDRRRGTDLPRSDNHDGDMADVTAKLHSSKNGNFSARKDPVYIN